MRRRGPSAAVESTRRTDDGDSSDEAEAVHRHLASVPTVLSRSVDDQYGDSLSVYCRALVTLILSYIYWVASLGPRVQQALEEAGMGIARWIMGSSGQVEEPVPMTARESRGRVVKPKRKRDSAGLGEPFP